MGDDSSEALRKARDEFHMVIGYCVAAWAQVDDKLFRIFRDCLGPYDQSAVIYYRTPGLDIRFTLTDEIVKTTLLPSWERPGSRDRRIKAWRAVYLEFDKLLSTRRRIAHQPVRTEPPKIGMRIGDPLTAFEIYVSRHEALRDSARKLPPVSLNDLLIHRQAVNALSDRLQAFFDDVLTKPATASSPPEPPPRSGRGSGTGRPSKPRRRRQSSRPCF
jgi:hypothetical protein